MPNKKSLGEEFHRGFRVLTLMDLAFNRLLERPSGQPLSPAAPE